MPASDTVFEAFEPLRLRYLDSPVPDWLRQAGDAVLSLLPPALRRQLGAGGRRLLLGLDAGHLQLHALDDDGSQLLGVVPLDDPELLEQLRRHLDQNAPNVPRWLLLDASQTLRPVLTVPASAEPRLREVMLHEIDRQTPFAPDQVGFEPRVLARDAATRQMRVELVVLPKTRLDAALLQLGPMAAGLAGVDAVDAAGRRLDVNLLPSPGRGVRRDRARHLNRWLALVAVVALFSAMWLALGNRERAFAETDTRVAAVRDQAKDVRRVRNGLKASVDAANFFARVRSQQPTMLELLNDLTARVPDSTALEKLTVSDGSITLIGQSQQASALVGQLQGSPLIRRPTLTGSVQTDPRTGKERFTLTAVVAGSDKEREANDATAASR
jgi:general secretion pathway protein L